MAAPDHDDPAEPLESLARRGLLIRAADVKFVRLPESHPAMAWYRASSWEDIPDSPCSSINPAEHEFVATQPTLRLDAIRYYVNSPDRTFINSDPDLAVELLRLASGQLLIMEGHHRIAGALVAGWQLDAYIGDLTAQHMSEGHAHR
jgi:hypothetical protein